jgi:thiol:disulfide interchange protein DsbA
MLTVLASLLLVPAMAATPVEGKDYTRLAAPQPTTDPKKVMVTEFFSYQCPHCFSFSKPFAEWVRKVPADVMVERVPVSFGRPAWESTVRAYLVLNSMNVVSKVDDALFEAIHVKHLRLDMEQELFGWIATTGIDAKDFRTQYRSFGIETMFKSAEARTRAHQIPGIPAIVIDGRYLVSIMDNRPFGPQLAVVNELISKARKEKPGKP